MKWKFYCLGVMLCVQPVCGQPTLTKVTTGPIVEASGNFRCPAWGDYDGDGDLDLLLRRLDGLSPLFRNDGNGVFVETAAGPLGADGRAGVAAAWADCDNDGDPDVLYCGAAVSALGNEPTSLFVNADGFLFEERPIPTIAYWASGIAWGDYNKDSFLDFFVSHHAWTPNELWRGDGAGGFNLDNVPPEMNANVSSLGAAWADCDGDGDLDLFVTCGATDAPYPCELYRNDGPTGFTPVTDTPLTESVAAARAACWGDYDNDGLPDLFVAYWWLDYENAPHGNLLYHNDGNFQFTRVTSAPIGTDRADSMSASWGDYDNDGDLDLFVANKRGSGNFLYRNDGNGEFVPITTGSVIEDYGAAASCSWVDYDQDGFLDLSVAWENPLGRCGLYHNGGNENHSLTVRLQGTESNRSGIGAKVIAHAMISGRETLQFREIHSVGTTAIGIQPIAHFGLGDATKVGSLRIEWPSGIVQELNDVAPNQMMTVTEPARLVPFGNGEFQVVSWINQSFHVEASTDLDTWATVDTITNETGVLTYEDVDADQHDCRYYRVVAVVPGL